MTRALRTARWGAILTFVLGGLLCGTFTVRIPALTDKLGIPESSVGLALLAWGLGALLSMQSMRGIMARAGSKGVLRVAAPLCAATLLLVGLAPSFPLLVGAALVFGMTFGAVDVAMNAQGSTVERAYGRPLMSGMHAGWCVGAISAGLIGTAAIAAGLSLTAHMAIVAVLSLPASVVLSRTYLADRVTGEAKGPRRRLPGVVYLLGAITFGAFMVEGVVADWNGLFLRDTLMAPESLAALGYPIFEAGMLLGRLSGDRLRTRFGAPGLMGFSGLATAATFAVVVVAPSAIVALSAMLFVGIAVATISPLALSLAGTATDTPGPAIAQAGAMGYAGLLLGPVVVGFLSGATSLRVAMVTAVVLGVLIAVATRFLSRARTAHAEITVEPERLPVAA
ncbi:MFS transporter [Microtetraspora sp. AC03309]|uniref:MFS transporter n=1 Tax=Microtetraspora sp. AC03309 TaxID=2779376 RepID=UPI001E299569|nr:MFS transporter [Microtetraspora sp. AC03309]MCC5577763.1 MFS transporter [Microtetraspora sp. AC03309]